jgi:hypothetical protein
VPRLTSRRLRLPQSANVLLVTAALATASTAPALAPASPSQQTPRSATTQTPQLHDSLTRQGPFTLGNQRFSVLFHYKVAEAVSSAAARTDSTSTLALLEILDARGNSVYQQNFSYAVSTPSRRLLTASASLLPGAGGVALVIRFLDRPVASPESTERFAKESWQLFGMVNGHLAPLGPVLPLGHGSHITVGGTLAAVMTKGGIAVMPMASTAEVLSFRAWTGNFYAAVPVRFDWAHGQWGEGEQCYQTAQGTLTERGCIMPVQATPQPRSPDADTLYVQLFAAPDGETDNSLNVPVSPDSRLEFLEMQAIVQWQVQGPAPDQGQPRVSCTFSNVWLRTRIDGQEGWVHGQEAFDALGLPMASPQ